MTQQWGRIVGKSDSHIRRMLMNGVRNGKVERREFRVRLGRVIRKEAHYRLIGSR